MMKWYLLVMIIMPLILTSYQEIRKSEILDEEIPVANILEQLSGETNSNRPDTTIAGVTAARGRQLVFQGEATHPENGLTNRRISKFFTCDACHNSVREFSNFKNSDPEDRLQYAIENNIPFLPGSTFRGIVNRELYYNDDYFKKYGQLVFATRQNLREAIQLCATECSQGRLLEDWEVESILAYFWELELKIGDLNLEKEEFRFLERALSSSQNKEQKAKAIELVKTKYSLRSPATFMDPPGNRNERLDVIGDPITGEAIYRLSCQHCHYDRNFSYFLLDESRMTFRYLYKHIPDFDKKSIYQVIRYGTPPLSGKHAYMPQYTEEKMNRNQVIDLVTYIKREAGKL